MSATGGVADRDQIRGGTSLGHDGQGTSCCSRALTVVSHAASVVANTAMAQTMRRMNLDMMLWRGGDGGNAYGVESEEKTGSVWVERDRGDGRWGWGVRRVRKRRRGSIESGGDDGAWLDGRAGRREERGEGVECGPRVAQSLGMDLLAGFRFRGGSTKMRGSRVRTVENNRAPSRVEEGRVCVGKRGEQREGRGAWKGGVVKTA